MRAARIVSFGVLFHFGWPHKSALNLSIRSYSLIDDLIDISSKEKILDRQYKRRINTTLQNFNESHVAAWAKGSGKIPVGGSASCSIRFCINAISTPAGS
jgi:hypothetical protein